MDLKVLSLAAKNKSAIEIKIRQRNAAKESSRWGWPTNGTLQRRYVLRHQIYS